MCRSRPGHRYGINYLTRMQLWDTWDTVRANCPYKLSTFRLLFSPKLDPITHVMYVPPKRDHGVACVFYKLIKCNEHDWFNFEWNSYQQFTAIYQKTTEGEGSNNNDKPWVIKLSETRDFWVASTTDQGVNENFLYFMQ